MAEKTSGVIEKSSDKLRKAAAIIGLVALAGSVIAPELIGVAVDAGIVWLGSDYINSTSKRKRTHAEAAK
jgi:hypothetical protein